MNSSYPIDLGALRTTEDIDHALSVPSPGVIETLSRLSGDLVILGVSGKMGPTLALMARKASEAAGVKRRIFGVGRFSTPDIEARLRHYGIEPVRCDLLDRSQLSGLPEAPLVVYMAGMKFGSTGQEPLTWAMNCHLPALVCERYRRSRIVAFSTGNIYGLTPVTRGGSVETDTPNPLGDYAMSCLGRERMFDHFSRTLGLPVLMFRLNYAVELRYGVLIDIARQVWHGDPVDVTMGYCNVIWQPDANAMALQSLDCASSPMTALNVTGGECLAVRDVAAEFGRLMEKPVRLTGSEAPDALLSNATQATQWFGPPRVNAQELLEIVADWVQHGGTFLGKPTHFESRSGKF